MATVNVSQKNSFGMALFPLAQARSCGGPGLSLGQGRGLEKTISSPDRERACLAAFLVAPTVVPVIGAVEMEHVEEVAYGRHIARHIGIVLVAVRIGEIVAAARGERLQSPLALNEFED